MPINITPAALALYQDCERIRAITMTQRQPRGQVYLIYRFDDNDSTLGAMWDSGFSNHQTTTVQFGVDSQGRSHAIPRFDFVEKQQIRRGPDAALLDNADRPVRGKAGVVKSSYEDRAQMQGGGHAEEFFLRHLSAVVKQSLNGGGQIPTKIDIYISRIPCGNTSPAWLVDFNGGSIYLPFGCGPKLVKAAKMLSGTHWNIYYSEEYGPGAQRDQSRGAIAQLNNLANVEAGRLSFS